MQFKLFALSALVAAAAAKPQASIPASDLAIIATILPSSADALIQASGEAAFSKHVASEFKAGKTPGWFTKLPTDIQTLLVPAGATATVKTSIPVNSTITGKHTTVTSATKSLATLTEKHTGVVSSASSSSSGSGAVPTAVVGAGLAGVAGLVGLLAL